MRGDANRLRQVVWHLLANAIKFTPRGGRIDVRLESDEHACVTVRDTGPGIAQEFLPRIFDRFTQADSSPTRISGGLGVGLRWCASWSSGMAATSRVDQPRRAAARCSPIRLPLHAADQPMPSPAAAAPTAGVRLGAARRRARAAARSRPGRAGAAERRPAAAGRLGARGRRRRRGARDARVVAARRAVSDAMSPERDAYSLVGKVQSLESDRGGRIPALALTIDGADRREHAAPAVGREARSAEAGGARGAHRGGRTPDRARAAPRARLNITIGHRSSAIEYRIGHRMGRVVARRLTVGAELQQDGGAHVRVWAPRRPQVELVIP